MIPLTMFDTCNFLNLTIEFKDSTILKLSDPTSSAFFISCPNILNKIKNKDYSLLDLSSDLLGEDSLDLLIKLITFDYSIEDISKINWKLDVIKDNESTFTIKNIFLNNEIDEVIDEAFMLAEESQINVIDELYDFLSSILKFEISHGFDFRKYFNLAISNLDKSYFYPDYYEVTYSYTLDVLNDKEELVVNFVD